MEKTPVVVGFQGENTVLPQSLLPQNVAQYGKNNMYDRGLAKKRSGFTITGTDIAEYDVGAPARVLLQFGDAVGDYYVWGDSSGDVYVCKDTLASGSALMTVAGASVANGVYWAETFIDNTHIVISNYPSLLRVSGANAYNASIGQFDETGVLASGSGAGAFNGTYLYKFAWRSSTDGTESELSDSVTCVATNDAQLDISVLPTTAPTNSGVDKIRIYRTITGGAIYYYVADKTIGTSTYTDTTTDANLQLNARMDEYRGQTNTTGLRGVFSWQDRLWACYEDGLIFSEKSANDLTIDSMSVWSRMYPENYVAVATTKDGGVLAGVPLSATQAILFRESSIEILSGVSPETYVIQTLSSAVGIGLDQVNSIVRADSGIYFCGNNGIYLLTNGFQLVNIGKDKIATFPSISYGTWIERDRAYLVSDIRTDLTDYDSATTSFSRLFYEESQQWAYWSVGFDSMYEEKGTFRGRRVSALPRGNSGVAVDGPAGLPAGTASGAVTGTNGGLGFSASGANFTDSVIYCNVLFVSEDGTHTHTYIQARTNSTSLETETPAVIGDTFYIGPIDWRYRTPSLSLSGDRSSYDAVKRIWAFFNDPQTGVDVTVKHYADGVLSGTHTLDSGNRTATPETTMPNARAREHYFEFSNPYPSEEVELEGYQIGFIRERSHDGN